MRCCESGAWSEQIIPVAEFLLRRKGPAASLSPTAVLRELVAVTAAEKAVELRLQAALAIRRHLPAVPKSPAQNMAEDAFALQKAANHLRNCMDFAGGTAGFESAQLMVVEIWTKDEDCARFMAVDHAAVRKLALH